MPQPDERLDPRHWPLVGEPEPAAPVEAVSVPRSRLYRLCAGLGKLVFGFVAFSFVLVLVLRFVPLPISAMMIERQVDAWFGGEHYRLRHDWVSLDEIAPVMGAAVIAAEDQGFAEHFGFDWKAIEKAMSHNERSKRVRGASTLTQQTAKNVFLWPQRSWIRKGLEAGYTVLIETIWGKRRVMEVYLNVAEMGPGVYGAEAGARHWFGVSAADLTPQQAARLAAILPSPRRYKAAPPGPYVRRRANRIQANARVVRNGGLASCVTG